MRFLWLLLLSTAVLPGCAQADPSALWHIVNGQCVPHEEKTRDPAPCAEVNLADGADRGYAVLKDIQGIAQFLLIPTARISGIEDPEILAPDAVNYWNAAWEARYFLEERLKTSVPREDISLAINSTTGRSQDQLHIHIDCIRKDVRDALARHLAQIKGVWTPFPEPLADHPYRSLQIAHETLDDANPFRLLADADPQAAAEMGRHTLVLVGAIFPDDTRGFVLLDGKADVATGNFGSGEELQDHACTVVGR